MIPTKFQRRFLRQYRELHESKSRKRVLLVRIFRSFLGAAALLLAMCLFLYFTSPGALLFFVPLGIGLVLGNSTCQLGDLMRRLMAWEVVEHITDWPKVYELIGAVKRDGDSA